MASKTWTMYIDSGLGTIHDVIAIVLLFRFYILSRIDDLECDAHIVPRQDVAVRAVE